MKTQSRDVFWLCLVGAIACMVAGAPKLVTCAVAGAASATFGLWRAGM